MTSVQIAHNWCAIVIRHRFQYTLEAIVVSYIHHHDVSTEKVNAVALRVYDDIKLKISDRIRRFMPIIDADC